MARLWQFSQGHPKPTFSKTVERGNQGKFFKNRPKNIPRLKGPKARWLKCDYPLISMPLNCKDWRRFRRKQRLQKCPNGQVMAIFEKSPKTCIFWKSSKGGPRKSFQKFPKKISHVWKEQKHSAENVIIPYLVYTSIAKTEEDFGANSGSKSARMAKL